MYNVYLSGPVTGLSIDLTMPWRVEAKKYLEACGNVRTFNPLRWSTFEHTGKCNEYDVIGDGKKIRARCLRDTKIADLVFVNCKGETGRISKGTMIEVGMAVAFGIPVIAVLDKGGTYDTDHFFVSCCDHVYYDFKMGMARCLDFLLP